ncbi:MAG: geranylgeranylglycerol-phosphate geranylgeranyltransferase [Thermoanaerobaculia bacterium]|nr:geranylgeranylglycerol-phosphate geranylgeranyltransferase [Thermoanaerobaculia bacterium]
MTIANSDQVDDTTPPDSVGVLVAAAGYFAVAIICSFAGYAVGHDRLIPRDGDWCAFGLLAAFLFPAYLNRAFLYEQASRAFLQGQNRRGWQRRLSWVIPTGFLLGLLLISVLWWRELLTNRCVWLSVGAATMPLYVLGIVATIDWPDRSRIYEFTFRSFFPAFATCLPTFVFGFVGCNYWQPVVGASATVMISWLLALLLPTKRFARVGLMVLLAVVGMLIVLSLKYDTEAARWGQACTFGILLTLAMGVAEAWRVTSRILRGVEFRPAEYTQDELIYYHGGTNAATALFLPCFVITAVHPATTRPYLWWVTVLLAVGYVAWFSDRTLKKRRWWTVAGVVFGLALPLVVSFFARVATSSPHVPDLRDTSLTPIANVLTIAAFMLVPLGFFGNVLRTRLRPGAILAGCVSLRACVAITGTTATGVVLLMSALWVLVKETGGVAASTEARLSGLFLAYLTIIALCSIFFFTSWIKKHFASAESPVDSKKDSSGDDSTHSLKQLWYAFLLTRPLASATAGALTLFAGIGIPSTLSVMAAIAMTAVTMFGFVVNDIFDEAKDRAAGVARPLAMRRMSRGLALEVAAFLFCLATACGAAVSVRSLAITVLIAVALLLYTYFVRYAPLLKGFYTAGLACTPLWYGCVASGASAPRYLYVILAMFVLGREALMDVAEREGDFAAGLRTLPVVFGSRNSTVLGVALIVAAQLLLIGTSRTVAAMLLAGTSATSLAIISQMPFWPTTRRLAATRVSMVIGALAVVAQLR